MDTTQNLTTSMNSGMSEYWDTPKMSIASVSTVGPAPLGTTYSVNVATDIVGGHLLKVATDGGYMYPNLSPNLSGANFEGPVHLNGPRADININGASLVAILRAIQDRLNILQPDPEMEMAWDELRQLREAYESKLAECRSKTQMWDTLNQP